MTRTAVPPPPLPPPPPPSPASRSRSILEGAEAERPAWLPPPPTPAVPQSPQQLFDRARFGDAEAQARVVEAHRDDVAAQVREAFPIRLDDAEKALVVARAIEDGRQAFEEQCERGPASFGAYGDFRRGLLGIAHDRAMAYLEERDSDWRQQRLTGEGPAVAGGPLDGPVRREVLLDRGTPTAPDEITNELEIVGEPSTGLRLDAATPDGSEGTPLGGTSVFAVPILATRRFLSELVGRGVRASSALVGAFAVIAIVLIWLAVDAGRGAGDRELIITEPEEVPGDDAVSPAAPSTAEAPSSKGSSSTAPTTSVPPSTVDPSSSIEPPPVPARNTVAPATAPPTTLPPSIEPPATDPPPTELVTTVPPATEPPATEPPTTVPPTTEPPTTVAPTTVPPTTEPPTTRPPTTVRRTTTTVRRTTTTAPPTTVRRTTTTVRRTTTTTEPTTTAPPTTVRRTTTTVPPSTEPPTTRPPTTTPPTTVRRTTTTAPPTTVPRSTTEPPDDPPDD